MNAETIKMPVGVLVSLAVWLFVLPNMLGAINGWYLQTVGAGVVDAERFDRVVGVVANEKMNRNLGRSD